MTIDRKLERLRKTIQLDRAQQELSETIASNIRHYRLKKGLTQQELSDEIGFKRPNVSRLERSDYNGYQVDTLQRVAQALGISIATLVRRRKA
jgi:transcriptional regulator with XRE-family HTH domain